MGYFFGRFAYEGFMALFTIAWFIAGFLILSALALLAVGVAAPFIVALWVGNKIQNRRVTNGNG